MAQSFKSNLGNYAGNTPGNKTFGVFKESQTAGDYIYNKKAKALFCKPDICKTNKRVGSESNYLLLRAANYLNYYSCSSFFDSTNLNMNLITSLDLQDVRVIAENTPPFTSPAIITRTSTPYIDYKIDPSDNLFGNTPCGLYNFLDYRIYNQPYNNPNPDNINSV